MIVVDVNVLAYLFISGTYTEGARATFLKDPEWCVPQLWRSELRSVLSLYMRKRQLSADDALRVMDEAEAIVEGREYRVSSADVFALVPGSGCSAYDCEYVALAKHLQVRLVTSDRQVLRAFPRVALSPQEFAGQRTKG